MADLNFDIWRLQSQGDIQGLIQLLKHANPDIRKRVATALRALGATGAIPALQSGLVSEADADVRNVVMAALDYLFEQETDENNWAVLDRQHQIVKYVGQLSSEKAEDIIEAAGKLAELKEKIAAEALILIFRNAEQPARVRLAAAEALLKLESAPVEVTLLRALRHNDFHIRRNAAGVLGQLHADWAVAALADALRDTQEVVRRTAYAALNRIATPEALKAISGIAAKPLVTSTHELPVSATAEVALHVPQTATGMQNVPAVASETTAPPTPAVIIPQTSAETPSVVPSEQAEKPAVEVPADVKETPAVQMPPAQPADAVAALEVSPIKADVPPTETPEAAKTAESTPEAASAQQPASTEEPKTVTEASAAPPQKADEPTPARASSDGVEKPADMEDETQPIKPVRSEDVS